MCMSKINTIREGKISKHSKENAHYFNFTAFVVLLRDFILLSQTYVD